MQEFQREFTALSIDLQQKVMEYIDFLKHQNIKKSKKQLSFNWAGGLKDLKDKYTSVELQHEMLNLWSEKK